MATRTLITVPTSAARGEIIEIRALIAHPMETGFRADFAGKILPINIIRQFTCHFNDELVFSAELFPAISANPYLAFHMRATESGTLVFVWQGDDGFSQTERKPFTVT